MKTLSDHPDPVEPTNFIYDSPIHSEVEIKLRQLLLKLQSDDRILGIQVCAYKDGEVIIDTAAGVLGEDDPRPVQPNSLFPVFSVTKGITAGLIHWLVDNGKLKYDDNVSNIWPGFETNGKDKIKVHHVLNHTAGLHNSLSETLTNTSLMTDWNGCLNLLVASVPESEPGNKQLYHYLSFGWLCGGIIEHVTGKDFQDVLEDAIICPLDVKGEFYIGIPPGVESRLASLNVYMDDFRAYLPSADEIAFSPSTFQPSRVAEITLMFAKFFNTLKARRSIIPAANGHCSARALARYYATLAAGGIIPPSHPNVDPDNSICISKNDELVNRIFQNPKLHDAFLCMGDYNDLVHPNKFIGLGFMKLGPAVFGHDGLGGSRAFCDVEHQLAIAITVNKMTCGAVTAEVVRFICNELNVPKPLYL